MSKKYNSLVKNIGLFTIGSLGSKLITFILLPLYTAVLSTADFGTVDMLQTTAQLLMPILLLSIQDATLRFGMDKNYRKSDVLFTTLKITIYGTLILLIGLILIYTTQIFNLTLGSLVFLFLSFVFGALNNCFNLYLKAKDDARTIAISGILCTLVTCICNILLLVIFNTGISGYMISIALGLLLQVFYQFIFGKIYQDIHIKKNKNLSKEMISYSAPLIANSLAWWVNNASDRYILTWILGVAANGVYAIAYKIPTALTMLQSIFYNAWSISAIAEYDPKDKDGFIGNNYTTYSFLSIMACSAIMLANIPLATILYANDFFSAWTCVPFLLVGTVFNGIAQLEGSLFAAERKTKQVAITTVLGAIINTVCNVIFIPLLGMVGAALATFLGYFITWGLRTLYLSKLVKMKVEWRKHYLSILTIIIQATLTTLNICFVAQLICLLIIVLLHSKYIIRIGSRLIRKIK